MAQTVRRPVQCLMKVVEEGESEVNSVLTGWNGYLRLMSPPARNTARKQSCSPDVSVDDRSLVGIFLGPDFIRRNDHTIVPVRGTKIVHEGNNNVRVKKSFYRIVVSCRCIATKRCECGRFLEWDVGTLLFRGSMSQTRCEFQAVCLRFGDG